MFQVLWKKTPIGKIRKSMIFHKRECAERTANDIVSDGYTVVDIIEIKQTAKAS